MVAALPLPGTLTGGRDPASALALLGQHLAPVPFANEQVGLGGRRVGTSRGPQDALHSRLHVSVLLVRVSGHWVRGATAI